MATLSSATFSVVSVARSRNNQTVNARRTLRDVYFYVFIRYVIYAIKKKNRKKTSRRASFPPKRARRRTRLTTDNTTISFPSGYRRVRDKKTEEWQKKNRSDRSQCVRPYDNYRRGGGRPSSAARPAGPARGPQGGGVTSVLTAAPAVAAVFDLYCFPLLVGRELVTAVGFGYWPLRA